MHHHTVGFNLYQTFRLPFLPDQPDCISQTCLGIDCIPVIIFQYFTIQFQSLFTVAAYFFDLFKAYAYLDEVK